VARFRNGPEGNLGPLPGEVLMSMHSVEFYNMEGEELSPDEAALTLWSLEAIDIDGDGDVSIYVCPRQPHEGEPLKRLPWYSIDIDDEGIAVLESQPDLIKFIFDNLDEMTWRWFQAEQRFRRIEC